MRRWQLRVRRQDQEDLQDAVHPRGSHEHSASEPLPEDEVQELPDGHQPDGDPRRGRCGLGRGRSSEPHDDAPAVQEVRLGRELAGLHGPRDGSGAERQLPRRAGHGDGARDQAVRVLRERVRQIAVHLPALRPGRTARRLLAAVRPERRRVHSESVRKGEGSEG